MQLSFKVHKPSDFIFNYLTDMQLFASVHPVITRIEQAGNNEYKVFEKFMLGPIPYAFTYKAFLQSDKFQNMVTINAIVMRLTKIEMQFHIVEEHGFCTVNEKVTFKSPLPIQSLMQKVFKSQHTKLFENIDKL